MSADELRRAAKVLRERAEAATPGPWERGHHWHIQGATHCACVDGGPANERNRSINGKQMLSHAHRRTGVTWPHGINTAALQDDGFPYAVVTDSDEYGRMRNEDATYIAAMHPGVGSLLADLLEHLATDYENAEVDGRTLDHALMPLARLILAGAS